MGSVPLSKTLERICVPSPGEDAGRRVKPGRTLTDPPTPPELGEMNVCCLFFKKQFYLVIYIWLNWVFLLCGFSMVGGGCSPVAE